MNDERINQLTREWDEVYKKGQLSLWVLLSLADGKKYSAEITQCMFDLTNGSFDVKEQSLYRALRRFEGMKLVRSSRIDSPSSGPPRKYFELTDTGREVLKRFIQIHIDPLYSDRTVQLINQSRGGERINEK